MSGRRSSNNEVIFCPRWFLATAFTLIELLTVIAIIGILSGLVIGVGRHASESGKVARAKVELAVISSALEGYKRQYGDYPRTNNPTELLQALIGKLGPSRVALNPQGRVFLDLAHLSTDAAGDPLTNSALSLADPWAQAYLYAYKTLGSSWANSSYVLYSIGTDGLDDSILVAGGFPNRKAEHNLDNIYANF